MPEFENWYKDMVDEEDEIIGHPAGTCPCCNKMGYHFECQESYRPIIDKWNKIGAYFETLGYKSVNVDDSQFQKAESTLIQHLKIDISHYNYESSDSVENEDTYFIPISWIGCIGHLVTKDEFKVITFGSGVGYQALIWAYYEGIRYGAGKRNSITIEAIEDMDKTRGALHSFLNRDENAHISPPILDSLPIVLEDVDLYFGISQLFEARLNNWFEFEID